MSVCRVFVSDACELCLCVWSKPVCVPSKGPCSLLVDQQRKCETGERGEGVFVEMLSSFQGKKSIS